MRNVAHDMKDTPATAEIQAESTVLRPTWRDQLRYRRTTLAVLAAAMLVYLTSVVIVPEFATVAHLSDTLQIAGFLGIVAVGEGIVILGSGIDLSVAYVVTGVGVLASSLTAAGAPAAVVLLAGLGAGVMVGLVNGIGVTRFKIPPLVMTLAMGNVIQGIVLVATNGSPNSGSPSILVSIANHNLGGGLTGTVVVWAVLAVAAAGFLGATRSGRYLYALGTNTRVAQLSGVPVARVSISTYMISGFTAAVGGCLLLGYTGISSATMGDAYLLPAIAAVVLGGTSILGGRGTSFGTALGAFLLTVIESLLTVLKVSQAGREMLEGAILLIVVVLYNARFIKRR
jgi:ribose transport system permease protein